MDKGRLFVVATPIGNLEDITARALRVLRDVHVIAAEDTRHSRRLLDHYGISTPLTSYHEHNELTKTDALLSELEHGRDVALVSDAGTPAISDPGFRLVRAARERCVEVIAVPGPSSLVAALCISGLPSDRFTFYGFFPRKAGQIELLLSELELAPGTHVFFESPHRLAETLRRLNARLPRATVCVARELTKIHEEVVLGTPAELAARFTKMPPRGECVLLLHMDAAAEEIRWDQSTLRTHVERTMERNGMSRRDAVRHVAAQLGVPRNVVYAAAMEDS